MDNYRVIRTFTRKHEIDRAISYGNGTRWWNYASEFEDIFYHVDRYEVRQDNNGAQQTICVQSWQEIRTVEHSLA
jgi:hypothetical protein